MTWSGFPKEGVQANCHPFTGEFIPFPSVLPSLEPHSPSFFLSHYLTLSFLKCPIVSRRHLLTYLWASDLVKALWPPRKSNYTYILPLIDIYNLKKKKWRICPWEQWRSIRSGVLQNLFLLVPWMMTKKSWLSRNSYEFTFWLCWDHKRHSCCWYDHSPSLGHNPTHEMVSH